MKLPACAEIAALFARANTYVGDNDWPRVATPKLNGIRAMWVPSVGLFSKDGVPYTDGVLPHIEAALKDCPIMLDMELFNKELSLQEINSRAGVIRTGPHPDHARIQAWIIDAPHGLGGHDERMDQIQVALQRKLIENDSIVVVPAKISKCCRTADAIHAAYVSLGYEGTVYKSYSHYRPGKTDFMLKRKAWEDAEFAVVRLVEGDGKYAGTLGAVICRTAAGEEFSVGSFEMPDDERDAAWFARDTWREAKIKYQGLTDRGVPYTTRVLQFIA